MRNLMIEVADTAHVIIYVGDLNHPVTGTVLFMNITKIVRTESKVKITNDGQNFTLKFENEQIAIDTYNHIRAALLSDRTELHTIA